MSTRVQREGSATCCVAPSSYRPHCVPRSPEIRNAFPMMTTDVTRRAAMSRAVFYRSPITPRCHAQRLGVGMAESVKQAREEERRDQNFGDWRGIFSAWAIAVFVVMLFIGVQAVAALGGVSLHQASFAGGAQVPRHDPACAGPGIPDASADSQCRLPGASFDRGDAAGPYANPLW
jgi:hypothetical protein